MTVVIPNRTILVHFGGISGEFGRAMVCLLVRRSRAKIPTFVARPDEPDISPMCTKMVLLGIYCTQISLNFRYIPDRDFPRINMSVSSQSFLIGVDLFL